MIFRPPYFRCKASTASAAGRTGNADRQALRLVLHMGEEGRLGGIDRRGADHHVGAAQKPTLQRTIKVQKHFLLLYIAVPVQDHLALIAGKEEGKAGHRVGMVGMDDVVVLASLPQHANHIGGYHRGRRLRPCAAAYQPGMRSKRQRARASIGKGTHHVAIHTALGKPDRQVVHHLLHAAKDGIEFA